MMKLPGIDENNRHTVFLLGALAGIAGSIVTVLLAVSACVAANPQVAGRRPD